MEALPHRIDMHIHTDASDGTDSPAELLGKIQAAGIGFFSVTDHDTVKNCAAVQALRGADGPDFTCGVELSCEDEEGEYHILGYACETEQGPLYDVVRHTREMRMRKVRIRMDFLQEHFGFSFPQEDIDWLWSQNNPGKPHIANLMIKNGYAADRNTAIRSYINLANTGPDSHIRPEIAITAILGSGGIPVLAHAPYGNGSQLVLDDALEHRVRKLIGFGLLGVECYYSGFTPKLQEQMLDFADRYDLLASAGSDYHGTNKLVPLGDVNLPDASTGTPRLRALWEACLERGR